MARTSWLDFSYHYLPVDNASAHHVVKWRWFKLWVAFIGVSCFVAMFFVGTPVLSTASRTATASNLISETPVLWFRKTIPKANRQIGGGIFASLRMMPTLRDTTLLRPHAEGQQDTVGSMETDHDQSDGHIHHETKGDFTVGPMEDVHDQSDGAIHQETEGDFTVGSIENDGNFVDVVPDQQGGPEPSPPSENQPDSFMGMGLEPRPPSEKQLNYASRLAEQLSIARPEFRDMAHCSEFIDDCLGRLPPSEAQISFANAISQQAGIALPEGATSSRKACSEYIEANKNLVTGGGSVSPANTNWVTGGGSVSPANANLAPGASSTSPGGSVAWQRKPTQNQILYAVELAQQRNLGLTAEQLQDGDALGRFIDRCQGGRP